MQQRNDEWLIVADCFRDLGMNDLAGHIQAQHGNQDIQKYVSILLQAARDRRDILDRLYFAGLTYD